MYSETLPPRRNVNKHFLSNEMKRRGPLRFLENNNDAIITTVLSEPYIIVIVREHDRHGLTG